MQTAAQITTSINQTLLDITAATFLAAETAQAVVQTKITLAAYAPYNIRHTLTTTASRILSLGKINNLMDIVELEYPIDEDPRSFHNFERRGMELSISVDVIPTAGESVYLYITKPHVIMAATDLVGAVNLIAGYAAGTTTIAIDAMGASDVLEEDSVFTIAGLAGSYRLTAATTLVTNAGDITFSPGLAAAVLDNAVITFYPSTLFDPRIESAFIDMAAGQLAINHARSHIGAITIGAATTPAMLMNWGQAKLNDVKARLSNIIVPPNYEVLARG